MTEEFTLIICEDMQRECGIGQQTTEIRRRHESYSLTILKLSSFLNVSGRPICCRCGKERGEEVLVRTIRHTDSANLLLLLIAHSPRLITSGSGAAGSFVPSSTSWTGLARPNLAFNFDIWENEFRSSDQLSFLLFFQRSLKFLNHILRQRPSAYQSGNNTTLAAISTDKTKQYIPYSVSSISFKGFYIRCLRRGISGTSAPRQTKNPTVPMRKRRFGNVRRLFPCPGIPVSSSSLTYLEVLSKVFTNVSSGTALEGLNGARPVSDGFLSQSIITVKLVQVDLHTSRIGLFDLSTSYLMGWPLFQDGVGQELFLVGCELFLCWEEISPSSWKFRALSAAGLEAACHGCLLGGTEGYRCLMCPWWLHLCDQLVLQDSKRPWYHQMLWNQSRQLYRLLLLRRHDQHRERVMRNGSKCDNIRARMITEIVLLRCDQDEYMQPAPILLWPPNEPRGGLYGLWIRKGLTIYSSFSLYIRDNPTARGPERTDQAMEICTLRILGRITPRDRAISIGLAGEGNWRLIHKSRASDGHLKTRCHHILAGTGRRTARPVEVTSLTLAPPLRRAWYSLAGAKRASEGCACSSSHFFSIKHSRVYHHLKVEFLRLAVVVSPKLYFFPLSSEYRRSRRKWNGLMFFVFPYLHLGIIRGLGSRPREIESARAKAYPPPGQSHSLCQSKGIVSALAKAKGLAFALAKMLPLIWQKRPWLCPGRGYAFALAEKIGKKEMDQYTFIFDQYTFIFDQYTLG
ncbi:hypothetical protein VP01_2036g2 [Puccinia sorghi]|uniref:Uncharacterized protein n=1 Tax=Puccinia sorghi TaxID=27349 RepID=A0A0L6VAX5_9BASI|nr:hypothetical protein VP01_2036g2 [Puccinia sorghi]